jgi:hypothetical protein
MKQKDQLQVRSPLFLASLKRFEEINWGNLTESDIANCDDKGVTLLHYCAQEGLWRKLPEKFRDTKYWKPTLDGTTVFMCAVQSENAKWINEHILTPKDLLKQNEIGESILSLAILNDNLNAIPKKLLTKELLKENLNEKEKYIHFISRNRKIKIVEWELLDEEVLAIQDHRGNSSYHLLAENETLRLIPRHLITLDKMLTENKQGMTPLDILVCNEDPKELLNNEFFTEEVFFKEKDNIEAPIHAWADGRYWANIPKKFITTKNLKSKGKETLLKSIISQYGRQAVWYNTNDESLKKMTDLVRLSVQLGDKKEIQEILKEAESLEKGDTYPNGIKKTSTLIKEELTKRKILEEILINEKALEI